MRAGTNVVRERERERERERRGPLTIDLRPYKITNLILIHLLSKKWGGEAFYFLFTIDTSLATLSTELESMFGKGLSLHMRNSNKIFAGGWGQVGMKIKFAILYGLIVELTFF